MFIIILICEMFLAVRCLLSRQGGYCKYSIVAQLYADFFFLTFKVAEILQQNRIKQSWRNCKRAIATSIAVC